MAVERDGEAEEAQLALSRQGRSRWRPRGVGRGIYGRFVWMDALRSIVAGLFAPPDVEAQHGRES